MRRISRLSVLCLAAGVVSACALPDEIVATTAIPTAGVRFINAVPDTGMMDFGFYDYVENSRHFQIAFRNTPVVAPTGAAGVPASTTVQYKAAQSGSRKFRIFMNPICSPTACNFALAAQGPIKDTTVTLTEGANYTVILWGYANPTGPGRPVGAPAMKMTMWEENVAAPAAGQVAVRIINATMTAIDGSVNLNGSAEKLVPDAAWTNVAPLTAGAYQTVAAGTYNYKVSAVGAHAVSLTVGVPLYRRALVGAAEVLVAPGPFDAVPGTSVAGTAVTGIVFPASVAGTGAPQGAGSTSIPPWTGSTLSFMWDRRPPRSPGV
jgi:hypothetical protein